MLLYSGVKGVWNEGIFCGRMMYGLRNLIVWRVVCNVLKLGGVNFMYCGSSGGFWCVVCFGGGGVLLWLCLFKCFGWI